MKDKEVIQILTAIKILDARIKALEKVLGHTINEENVIPDEQFV